MAESPAHYTSTLTFHGGAGSVTGANFLLESATQKILVDCGLLQGGEFADAKNWEVFPYDPASIDALFVTHAHTDHIGRIPRLVAQGFSGRIISTPPTKDIARIMFEDAERVMREELKHLGNPRPPLYSTKDIENTLELWETHLYHENIPLKDAMSVRMLDAGHVLGSAMYEFSRNGKTLVFTGDLGNKDSPLARRTESIEADYLVMESVYGDRNHEGTETRREVLRNAIERTRTQKGVLLIPAFSLERTQLLLYEIDALLAANRIVSIPVYLDAPLAIKLMDVYRRYPQYMNDEVEQKMKEGDPFSFPKLIVTASAEDSRAIDSASNPKVIIAGSGMSHGGRIRSHEKRFLSDPTTTILFAGYQAAGSLGRRLAEGATRIEIDGEWLRVRAHTLNLQGYSAHADRDTLIEFVEHTAPRLTRVFIVMGEPRAALFLSQRLRDFLDVDAVAPDALETFTLNE